MATGSTAVTVAGVRIEMVERGTGRPLLFLHPAIGIDPAAPVLDALAAKARVIAPSHPGFGGSDQPKDMNTVDDLAYFYLDLLEALEIKNAILVGVSFGGWIAAEIAIKSTERIGHLVLADPVGIKVGDRETRDIADIFAMTEPQFNERAYFDPAAAKRDYPAMAEADLVAIARNREATARYAWTPYMHDPKLKGRLHRIGVPTLVLWGAADRIVTPDYGRAYAAAIPGARFAEIARAGHFPHLEAADDFSARVLAFAAGRD
ncbi:MAG TPA: alpha/beta fold hydrolase [Stellaceae bacterium]|nr:alpha/beta fold hydrolase [Stellaceae bacterium]